jgi:UDP-glucuronate 4-epimerase
LTEKILITGGSGFIGSHLAEFFIENTNKEILIIDNYNSYYSIDQKRNNYKILKNKDRFNKIKLIEGDIRNKKLIDSIFKSNHFSQIFHLAAMAGVRYSIENPTLYFDVNLKGTLNLLNATRDNNIKSFIFASSSSVYGNSKEIPFSEQNPLGTLISPYAITKRAGEDICRLYHDLYQINISCLRFFTVYGPRGRPDMAAYKFMHSIYNNIPIDKYGDGNTERDYTYIDDIIQGIISAANKNKSFEIFNLGGNSTTNLNKFINMIEEIVGKKAKINHFSMQVGDVEKTKADISKAKHLLDYYPKTTLEEGIKKMFKWFINYHMKQL